MFGRIQQPDRGLQGSLLGESDASPRFERARQVLAQRTSARDMAYEQAREIEAAVGEVPEEYLEVMWEAEDQHTEAEFSYLEAKQEFLEAASVMEVGPVRVSLGVGL